MADRVEIDILARVDSAVSGIEKFVKGIAAAYIGVQGLQKAWAFAASSLNEFIEAEQAQAKLAASFRVSGQYSKEAVEGMVAYSKALQLTTTYTEEQTQEAASMLLTISNLTTGQIKKAIPVLMDYASAMGVDLSTAATQFAQALEGGRNVFAKYGIDLADAKGPTEKFATLVDGLKGKFEGLSEAMAGTTGGQLTIFKNQLAEFKENFGGWFAQTLLPALQEANKLFEQISINSTMKDLSPSVAHGTASSGQRIQYYTQAIKEVEAVAAQIKKDMEAKIALNKRVGDYGSASNEDINKLKNAYSGVLKILQDYRTGLSKAQSDADAYSNQEAKAAEKEAEALKNAAAAAAEYARMLSLLTTTGNQNNEFLSNRIRLLSDPAISQPSWVGEQVALADEIARPSGSTNSYGMDTGGLFNGDPSSILPAVGDLKTQYEDIADSAVKIADAMGEAFATGDFSSAIQMMMNELGNYIIQAALAAGVTALISPVPNYPLAASMFALAGFTAFGMGALNSGGSAAYSGPSNQYSSGATGRSVTVNVAGSVWTSGDLAREVAAVQQGW